MTGRVDGSDFYGVSVNSASSVHESELGHWYGAIPEENDAWFRLTKFSSKGNRIAGSYDWKNGNCDFEDAQKFRGRGFKQITGRSNYSGYWVFRGWIARDDFSANWWMDPSFADRNRSQMSRRPAHISDPQRVAFPENCVDSGGWYLRFERAAVAKNIDNDLPYLGTTDRETAKEKSASRAVTYAVNGGYNDEKKRLEYTRYIKKILI